MGAAEETIFDRIVSEPELAERLGRTPQCVGRWRRAGTGPRSILIGKRVAYLLDDVEEWLREGGTRKAS